MYPLQPSDNAASVVVAPHFSVEQTIARLNLVIDQGKKIILIFRSEGRSDTFDPSELRTIFEKFRECKCFQHLLLEGRNGSFLGYMPGAVFGFLASSTDAIVQYVLRPLADARESDILRTVGGAASDDTVSDKAYFENTAAKMVTSSRGALVILEDGRRNRPVGVLYKADILKIATRWRA